MDEAHKKVLCVSVRSLDAPEFHFFLGELVNTERWINLTAVEELDCNAFATMIRAGTVKFLAIIHGFYPSQLARNRTAKLERKIRTPGGRDFDVSQIIVRTAIGFPGVPAGEPAGILLLEDFVLVDLLIRENLDEQLSADTLQGVARQLGALKSQYSSWVVFRIDGGSGLEEFLFFARRSELPRMMIHVRPEQAN